MLCFIPVFQPGDDDHLFDPKPFRSYAGHSADILDLAWSKVRVFFSSCHVELNFPVEPNGV